MKNIEEENKYPLIFRFIMGSTVEILKRNDKVGIYTLNGINMNKYKEVAGLSKCIHVEVLLFTTFLGHVYATERIRTKPTIF